MTDAAAVSSVQKWTYHILWFVGATSAAIGLFAAAWPLLGPSPWKERAPDLVILGLFCLFSFYHLFRVYEDLEKMENVPQVYQSDYPGFFGTDFEKLLRIVAFFLLITVAGKFVPLFDFFSLREQAHKKIVVDLFVGGNAALFLTLCVWDFFGIRSQLRNGAVKGTAYAYLLSDFFACFFWVLISLSVCYLGRVPQIIIYLVGISVLIYILVIAGRILCPKHLERFTYAPQKTKD